MPAAAYHDMLGRYETFREVFDDSKDRGVDDGASVPRFALTEYNVFACIGKGAYACAFAARHTKSGRIVALKRMQKQHIVKSEMQEFVRNEVELLSELRNLRCVPKIIGTAADDSFVYIAMEYLPGGEMLDVVNRFGGLTERPHCQFVAACVSRAVAAVHRHGIVFRDLKLENLVVDATGYLRLIDFGLAKRSLVRTYTMCGSPRYCSPELITGRGVSFAGDWWSLGICLYECFFGYTVFDGDGDSADLWQNILFQPIEFHHSSSRRASEEFKEFLTRLLERDPTKRLGSSTGLLHRISDQKWFDGFDWNAFDERLMRAPYIPSAESENEIAKRGIECDSQEFEAGKYIASSDSSPGWLKAFS